MRPGAGALTGWAYAQVDAAQRAEVDAPELLCLPINMGLADSASPRLSQIASQRLEGYVLVARGHDCLAGNVHHPYLALEVS
jgi:hypothetical protein